MSPVHWHLLLNHVPVIGTILGVLLLAWGTIRKSEELKQASLSIFIGAAVIAIPAFLTGEPAEEVAERTPHRLFAVEGNAKYERSKELRVAGDERRVHGRQRTSWVRGPDFPGPSVVSGSARRALWP